LPKSRFEIGFPQKSDRTNTSDRSKFGSID
jgi:hypothetical protein